MMTNKQVVEKYIDGFNKSDHALILSCLTEDVEWDIPGAFHVKGKKDFDVQIESDVFVGNPIVKISRMVEENDVVVAEGSVRVEKRAGGFLNLVFCDVFVMKGGLIRHLTSYLAAASAI